VFKIVLLKRLCEVCKSAKVATPVKGAGAAAQTEGLQLHFLIRAHIKQLHCIRCTRPHDEASNRVSVGIETENEWDQCNKINYTLNGQKNKV
jgi:hypothetical protein